LKRTELERRFGTCLPLTAEQWAYAVLLGGARKLSNQERADTSDRGEAGNEEVDLHGALGELLLFGMVRDLPESQDGIAYMLEHLFVETGGKGNKGADLLFEDAGVPVGIDVKTFDCSPRKHFFAINYDKHAALAENNTCVGYMGLICPRFARNACITRLIPYAYVSTWKYRNLRKEGGSVSRNCPINSVMRDFAGSDYSFESNRRDVYSATEVRSLARQIGAGSPIARLSRLLPTAERLLVETQAAL
jgi:hypothetical protein